MKEELAGYLEITLHSPLCASVGQDYNGLVDIEIAQEFGLPVIPAKRLKGCLEAAGKELAAYDKQLFSHLKHLFGQPGDKQGGALRIGDAHLYQIPWAVLDRKKGNQSEKETHNANSSNSQTDNKRKKLEIKNYALLLRQLKESIANRQLYPQDILSLFTSLRTRSTVDCETGSARETALYTMRTVHKGLVFRSCLTLREGEDVSLWNSLQICADALRQIGMGVTRGFGEVQCKLKREGKRNEKKAGLSPSTSQEEEWGVCTYRLEALTPLLLPGQNSLYSSAGDFIPGRAILGALAGMFIADCCLGKAAHEQDDFRRIFLRGGVKFNYAFPSMDGKTPFYPCPGVLQREKITGDYYHAAYPVQEGVQLRSERRPVQIGDGSVTILEVEKEVRLHHVRPLDRSIGRALGETGPGNQAENGQLYQYAAISAGQYFTGSIEGKKKDLDLLRACVERRQGRLELGRSRTAEYGQAQLNFQPFQPLGEQEDVFYPEGQIALWLVSPLVLCDAQGRDSINPQLLIEQMNQALQETGQGFIQLHLEQSFLRFTKLGGYQVKWQLPRQQRTALDAGTALWVKVSARQQERLKLGCLEKRPWGELTGEGCGRIKILSSTALPMAQKSFKGYLAGDRQGHNVQHEQDGKQEENKFIDFLFRRKAELAKLQKQKKKALEVELKNLELSVIEQLQRIFYGEKNFYEGLIEEVGSIKNEEKKERVQAFLKPCEKAVLHLIIGLEKDGLSIEDAGLEKFDSYFMDKRTIWLQHLQKEKEALQEGAMLMDTGQVQTVDTIDMDFFKRQVSVFVEWYLKRAKWQARRQSDAAAEK